MRIFLLLLISTMALGQAEAPQPYEVKGVRLGSSLTDWQQGPGAKCKEIPRRASPDEEDCIMFGASFAGVGASEIVSFYKHQLVSFMFEFPNDEYDKIRGALEQKFGRPTSTKQKSYQNSFGASFAGESVLWDNGVSSISLEQIGGDRDHSVILFVHNALRSAAMSAKNKAKADDM